MQYKIMIDKIAPNVIVDTVNMQNPDKPKDLN